MKTAVIKLSGKSVDSLMKTESWIEQIKIFLAEYDGVAIVHGAGTIISDWAKKLNINTEFVNGHRVTSVEMMEVVAAVQNGIINAKIVSHLLGNGINSLGTNGLDHGLFTADYLDAKLGFVGSPRLTGDPGRLFEILGKKTIPVFSSVCRDNSGNLMNVNADLFTIALAEAINADSVIFLSDVEGVKIYGKTQPVITEHDINKGIDSGQITDGMIPKLESCLKLINNGAKKVWIGNNLENIKFNSNNSKGTWVVSANKLSA